MEPTPPGVNFMIVLLPRFATKRFPAPSKASPSGTLKPVAKVVGTPAVNFVIVPLPLFETKIVSARTAHAASKTPAIPKDRNERFKNRLLEHLFFIWILVLIGCDFRARFA